LKSEEIENLVEAVDKLNNELEKRDKITKIWENTLRDVN
jgi:hypothetical protein